MFWMRDFGFWMGCYFPCNGTRMTQILRIFTDLVLGPLTKSNEKTADERAKHRMIREDPSHPCHPCAMVRARVSMHSLN